MKNRLNAKIPRNRINNVSLNESLTRICVRMPPIAVIPSKSAPAAVQLGSQKPIINAIGPTNSTTPVTTRNHCGNPHRLKFSTCILEPDTFPNPAPKNSNARKPCKTIDTILSLISPFYDICNHTHF